MALSRTEALALLPDNLVGDVTPADMRAIIDAIYVDGVENIDAIGHRVDDLEAFDNNLLDDTPEPWNAQAYASGDVVSHAGRLWLAMQDQTADKVPGGTAPLTYWLPLTLERTARIANEGQYLLDAVIGAPINGWKAQDYPKGSIVDHAGRLFGAFGNVHAGDVPGVSPLWHEKSLVILEAEMTKLGDVVFHMTLGNHAITNRLDAVEGRLTALEAKP